MTPEKNKQLARDIIEKLSHARIVSEDLTDDFRAWSLFSGDLPREAWLSAMHGKQNVQDGPSNFTVTAMTAEADRVAVEYVSDTKLLNGKMYRNSYHTLLVFRHGKLARIKEFMDTRYLVDSLGPLVPRIADRAEEYRKLGQAAPRAEF